VRSSIDIDSQWWTIRVIGCMCALRIALSWNSLHAHQNSSAQAKSGPGRARCNWQAAPKTRNACDFDVATGIRRCPGIYNYKKFIYMLDCVTATSSYRRPTPPAYSAGLQRGLGRSRRPCARMPIAEPAPPVPPVLLEKTSRGACPSSSGAPPHSQPNFEREIHSDCPLCGEALRMCMLFLGCCICMLSCCCCHWQQIPSLFNLPHHRSALRVRPLP
jgi:hypothetical protein